MLAALKVALIISVSGSATFIAVYTYITKFAAWRDRIGLTIQLEATFLILTMLPILVASFWMLGVIGTKAATWLLIASMASTGVTMYWRALVFWQDRNGPRPKQRRGQGGQEP